MAPALVSCKLKGGRLVNWVGGVVVWRIVLLLAYVDVGCVVIVVIIGYGGVVDNRWCIVGYCVIGDVLVVIGGTLVWCWFLGDAVSVCSVLSVLYCWYSMVLLVMVPKVLLVTV